MRAKVNKKDLLSSVGRAVGVADRRSVVPILSHVKLEFSLNSLTIMSTDLDHSLLEIVPAEVDLPGSAAVSAIMLNDIVRRAIDTQLEFSIADRENKIVIANGTSQFALPVLKSSDFPELPPLEEYCTIKLLSTDLDRLLSHTKFSMSQEPARHNLNGIYLNKKESRLLAVSTDGHRLSLSEADASFSGEFTGTIISKKTVFEVKKLLDAECEVTIRLSRSQIKFEIGNVIFVAKLIDGVFPDYEKVIPSLEGDSFVVSRSGFISVIDRVSVVSDEKLRAVKLELDGSTLACYVAQSKFGTARDEIEVTYQGPQWCSGFNANYLMDIANALSCKNLRIFANNALSPMLIMDNDSTDSLFVVMPMRV